MYTVQPGDSLSRIAYEHNTTVQALIEANADRYPALQSNPGLLQVGWLLRIPGHFAPGESAAARPSYAGLRFGVEEIARGGQVADGVLTSLQRDLRALGYYGSRNALVGRFGPTTLGGILALKYDLIHTYGVTGDEIGYPTPDPVTANEMYAASAITPATNQLIHAMMQGKPVTGVLPWLLPTRDDVTDHSASVDDLVYAEYQAGMQLGKPFPYLLFATLLGKESGGQHFDAAGNIKYAIDWVGRRVGGESTYADVVEFNPDNESAPWVMSRGWGLTQYTPFQVADLPRPMPDYVLSIRANIRTAIDLFRGKFTYGRRNPCNFPTLEAPSFRCGECLAGWDPVTYTRTDELPCSWLLATWAYNGLSQRGFDYMVDVVRRVQATTRSWTEPTLRPAPSRPKTWLMQGFDRRR